MLEDLKTLLSCVKDPNSPKNDFAKAIIEDNCLGKRSLKTRQLSNRHLTYLYSLDPSVTIFRALRYFWARDIEGQPLLALLCAYSRDSLLKIGTPFILSLNEGNIFRGEVLEQFIDKKEPGRFSEVSLKSLVRHLGATWTKSGHLVQKKAKIRSKPTPTAGSVSYALFLGYLIGVRGEALFTTEYTHLLDCSFARCVELAEEASRRGWITFKHIGKVMEVQFPNLLSDQEKEWIHEQ